MLFHIVSDDKLFLGGGGGGAYVMMELKRKNRRYLKEKHAAGSWRLSNTLGVQLCGVNSQKTFFCSQKMRAGRV